MLRITCFISYSCEWHNMKKFEQIKNLVTNSNYCINYSERVDKRCYSDETIWNYLRKRIAGSSCTILLLTEDILSSNKYKIEYKPNDFLNSGWIYNELSASLKNGRNNKINGLVCVVEDNLVNKIKIFNSTIYGYDLPEILDVNKNYIIFVTYSEFIRNYYTYLIQACENRRKQIESDGRAFNIKYDLHNKKD